ncbi:MAG: hypothetical protein GY800_14025 [Planctomycetes bacterium]|nr:hypothetical protein [Planctomycetota bacterium]
MGLPSAILGHSEIAVDHPLERAGKRGNGGKTSPFCPETTHITACKKNPYKRKF